VNGGRVTGWLLAVATFLLFVAVIWAVLAL
jgi:hypothetical protein